MRDYEKGYMEDGDSGGDIHLDGGTDRTGHYIVHGRDDVRSKM